MRLKFELAYEFFMEDVDFALGNYWNVVISMIKHWFFCKFALSIKSLEDVEEEDNASKIRKEDEEP